MCMDIFVCMYNMYDVCNVHGGEEKAFLFLKLELDSCELPCLFWESNQVL